MAFTASGSAPQFRQQRRWQRNPRSTRRGPRSRSSCRETIQTVNSTTGAEGRASLYLGVRPRRKVLLADESDERELRASDASSSAGIRLSPHPGGRRSATGLSPLVAQMVETTFVFLDASLGDLELEGAKNVVAVRFADEQTSQLMGYLSALVPPRRGSTKARVDAVSIVAGPRSTPSDARDLGFPHGCRARAAGSDGACRSRA